MKNQSIEIPGPCGVIEAAIEWPANADASQAPDQIKDIAIVCHPHPLHGGTMNNKVVTTVARAFLKLGYAAIRFNYRGVGRSDGEFAQGEGETDDLFAVIDWVKKQFPNTTISLAGFSFGAYVATNAAHRLSDVKQLVLVAPAVHHHDYSKFGAITCPWIIVQGEDDEIVPPQQVFDWVATLPRPVTLIRMENTTHFFHGKLVELRDRLFEVVL